MCEDAQEKTFSLAVVGSQVVQKLAVGNIPEW